MSVIFVKPAVPGQIVRQHDRNMRPLAQEGEYVADTILWRRLIALGDVVELTPESGGGPALPSPVKPPAAS